ncbi:MAG: hypothetical protein ACR2Q3_18565 [Woeseiaceae bacterium]
MVRTIATLVLGALLGAFALLAIERFNTVDYQTDQEIVRDIVDVPVMSQAIADKHRDENYTNVRTVEQIVSLPTEFARSEALYALAGRSDPAFIQQLIFEADRVANDGQRIEFLRILFFRLAEADPNSALALSRIDRFGGGRQFEQIVWRTWGRMDLNGALSAASSQGSLARRKLAAQSLYAAFGFLGNDTVEQIESELGIGPDWETRNRYLFKLADKSRTEAIAFINGMQRGDEQRRNVQWLAEYIAIREPEMSLTYASLFTTESDGERFKTIINNRVARDNPQATIERLLAAGENLRINGEYRSAVRALASNDLEAARYYFEQARSADDRQMWGASIAAQMAVEDPVEALAWARENEAGGWSYIQMTVLNTIAETDPLFALASALEAPNSQMKSRLISMVVQRVANTDPATAASYLDQIPGRQQRLEVGYQLAQTWIQRDLESALKWIQSNDKETAGKLLQNASQSLLRSNIDGAIRILPDLPDQDRIHMRQQIAEQIATTRPPHEAQSFIAQFQGEPGFDKLQASLIAGVAQSDALAAKQMADQLASSDARDAAYVQVIGQRAQTYPDEAARWLSNVKNESMRGAAAGQLAAQWYGDNPDAATLWVSKLPTGTMRDDAIMHLSYAWGEPTAATDKLIASIADRDKRGQAKVRQVYSLMRSNPTKARELLQDEDIPSYQRQQVESNLNRVGRNF